MRVLSLLVLAFLGNAIPTHSRSNDLKSAPLPVRPDEDHDAGRYARGEDDLNSPPLPAAPDGGDDDDTGRYARSVCGNTDLTAPAGYSWILTSPGWSSGAYDNDVDCMYNLAVVPDTHMRLKLIQWGMEGTGGCTSDRIRVYDDDTGELMVTFCGSGCRNSVVTLPTDVARLHFETDSSVTNAGFKVQFWSVAATITPFTKCLCEGCFIAQETFTTWAKYFDVSTSGLVSAQQKKPFNYLWSISVDNTKHIRFTFTSMDLPCGTESVQIFKGDETSAVVEVCGEVCRPSVIIEDHVAYVRYVKLGNANPQGYFEALYEETSAAALTVNPVQCGCQEGEGCTAQSPRYGTACTMSGNELFSPNYPEDYDVYDYCIYDLEVPDGKHIELTLTAFDVEAQSACGWDRLEVYTGPLPDMIDFERYCGIKTGETITIQHNKGTLVFKSDEVYCESGFHISYAPVDPVIASTTPVPPTTPVATTTTTPAAPTTPASNEGYACGLAQTEDPFVNLPKIVGGVEVTQWEYPWQILLGRDGSFVCGGTLIANEYVLTAAHCVFNHSASQYTVYAGIHDMTVWVTGATKMRSVQTITIHSGYDSTSFDNDIAILKLSSAIPYSDYIQPICLTDTPIADGRTCTITGWGRTAYEGDISYQLLFTRVVVHPRSYCSNIYNSLLTDNMICADGDGQDACDGDSGGPLICAHDGVYKQYGVTSWGIGCGNPAYPGVYTNLVNYRDFIETTTENTATVYT